MNKYLSELIALSKIDKNIDSFAPQIEAAQKKIAKEQAKADDSQERIDTLAHAIDNNNEKITSYEEQIKILDEQLKSIQKKNKEISSEREMKALSLEEEIAKEKLTFANEEIERLGKINETKQSEKDELATAHEELTKAVKEASKSAGKEIAQIETQKEDLYKDREKSLVNIDQRILAFYEKIRKWAGNTAVVAVKKHACYGCYMKINDKTYSEVIRAEEIVTCPHCGRILYLETEETEA